MDARRPATRLHQGCSSPRGSRPTSLHRLGSSSAGLRWRRLGLQALALAAAAQTLLPSPATAQQQLPLECRLGDGAWRACTMTIARAGEHWWLQVGSRRLEFRSDGQGSITLSTGAGPGRSVMPAWQPDRALCWDGVCARGEFPLD
ncbi:hypothetical protein [Vulcanococcus limneticus]|uniref:hypothetical protein n=1 Tax=Vulcanococcus limneticus TaxID=2170428 RepID=UPI00398BC3BF